MSEGDFSKFVLQLKFSGEGKLPPKILPSSVAIRQVVQLTPGAVGIVAPGDVNDSVKVLAVN